MFYLDLTDYLRIAHPALTVMVVFPLIGIVLNMAWQTRQRRLAIKTEGAPSKIPPLVGLEHVKYGKWLAGAVVGTSLLGMMHPTARFFVRLLSSNNWSPETWAKYQGEILITIALFVVSAISLAFLYFARTYLWSIVFGILTGLGILLIGFQDLLFRPEQQYGAIFRRDDVWFASHFYLGITSALLMVISLVMIQPIYRDRSHRMRILHVMLNSLAFLLFLGQGFTGTRDLLEIPLSWQEPFVYGCDYPNKTCENLINKQSRLERLAPHTSKS
jgi:hypothetical protein